MAATAKRGWVRNRRSTGWHRINRRRSMVDKRSHRRFRGRHLTAARKRKIALGERRARRSHHTRYGRRTYFSKRSVRVVKHTRRHPYRPGVRVHVRAHRRHRRRA